MSKPAEFCSALLSAGETPAGLKTWNGSDPAARFAVYRNNVMVSLVDALATTFDVTRQLVGSEFFRAMARLFVRTEPPRSRVLAFYGETFPAFIEHFAPAASVPYLADVARLEMLRVQACHAADADAITVAAVDRALADPESLPVRRLRLHPAVRLLRSRHAVVALWAAHQGLAGLSETDPAQPENALVLRPQLEVEVMRLADGAAEFTACLMAGARLGAAAEAAQAADPEFDLTETLRLLLRRHAITSMEPTWSTA